MQYAPSQTSSFTEQHAFKVHPTLCLFALFSNILDTYPTVFVFIFPLEGLLVVSDIGDYE